MTSDQLYISNRQYYYFSQITFVDKRYYSRRDTFGHHVAFARAAFSHLSLVRCCRCANADNDFAPSLKPVLLTMFFTPNLNLSLPSSAKSVPQSALAIASLTQSVLAG